MQATEILKSEHRVIERVLDSLETAAARLDAGDAVTPGVFTMAADFVKGFADGCHHKKEEDVLFPAMQAAGIPAEGGPIGVMLDEHEQGRRLTATIRGAAERLAAGEADARADLVASTRAYIALLRDHIAKEDNVLFPMADDAISVPNQAALVERFATVEHEDAGPGVHERYLALAGAIEKAVGG